MVCSSAACPPPPLPAAAAAIPQRTADTTAPGSYSSRHKGTLPGQCVRPPSGQRAQRCTGHVGPHITFINTCYSMVSPLNIHVEALRSLLLTPKNEVLPTQTLRSQGFKCLMKQSTSSSPI